MCDQLCDPQLDFDTPTRVLHGAGQISQLGKLAKSCDNQTVRRVLVVSDPGVVRAGHTDRGIRSLEAAGLTTQLFDAVCENPTTQVISTGVTMAHRFKPDLIVGLGGGSAMDCAKGINFIYSCGGKIQDYWGVGKATAELLPMIAIPTTAGTGSETQSFALITDAETHVKMACGDKQAAFKIAILDPELTLTQPTSVTAHAGFDALAHALETYVTTRRNKKSLAHSRTAWKYLATNYPRVLQKNASLATRGAMQLGACYAGIAIENSMLGSAHALANPLTARFGIVHGEAVALMLPHVIRFNGQMPEVELWYHELFHSAFPADHSPNLHSGTEKMVLFVQQMAKLGGFKKNLSCFGITPTDLPLLAQSAATQWTGTFNPVSMKTENFLTLYQNAL